MDGFVEAAIVGDWPVGRIRSVRLGERKIALYRTATGFFASDDRCPHRGGPLSEGDLLGGEIVCPWHLWGFDVATGVCTGIREVHLVTHEVRLDGDRLFVKLSPAPDQELY